VLLGVIAAQRAFDAMSGLAHEPCMTERAGLHRKVPPCDAGRIAVNMSNRKLKA
jgi:hypothetical protein